MSQVFSSFDKQSLCYYHLHIWISQPGDQCLLLIDCSTNKWFRGLSTPGNDWTNVTTYPSFHPLTEKRSEAEGGTDKPPWVNWDPRGSPKGFNEQSVLRVLPVDCWVTSSCPALFLSGEGLEYWSSLVPGGWMSWGQLTFAERLLCVGGSGLGDS